MSNPQKARGTAWERLVLVRLDELGLQVRRNAQHGPADIGDLWAPGFALECKDHAKITLAEFVDQAVREAEAAREPYGVAIVKRRRSSVGEAYAITNLDTLARMMLERAMLLDQVERLVILLEGQAD